MSKKFSLFTVAFLGVVGISTALFHLNEAAAQRAGSTSGLPQTCVDTPVALNLMDTLAVDTINGQQAVIVDWGLNENGQDLNLGQKVDAFMSYLKTDPKIGQSDNSLKMAFAVHIYDAIQHSDNRAFQDNFYNAFAETVSTNNVLQDQNLDELFTDYYPYMFLEEVKTNANLERTFMAGVENGITSEKTISPQQLLGNLGLELEKVQGSGNLREATACLSRAVGSAEVADFVPGSKNSVYGQGDERMQEALNQLKAEGLVGPAITSILNDQNLIRQTNQSLDIGVNTLLNNWSTNLNVQNLLNEYKHNENIEELMDAFFASDIGQEVNDCMLEAYRDEILEMAEDVYLKQAKPLLENKGVYNEQMADAVIEAFLAENLNASPLNDEAVYDEARQTVMSFINSYLDLEQTVSELTGDNTPFADYYRNELSDDFTYIDGMEIKIYRDDTLIKTLTNQNITQYIDTDFPLNYSNQIQNHTYKIVTSNSCGVVTGESGKAGINPVVKEGTPVQTFANLDLRLRDKNSQFFMDYLHVLLNLLLNDEVNLESTLNVSQSTVNQATCDAARELFLNEKTSASLFNYALDCFGDSQINYELAGEMKDITTPLVQFLEFNEFNNMDSITQEFLGDIIISAQNKYNLGTQLANAIQPLKTYAVELLTVSSIDGFTEEQKDLMICGGNPDCPEETQEMIQQHLGNASHAAAIEITVYDENDNLINTVQTHTDIFGRAKNVDLGMLNANQNYKFNVSLVDQPYALSKVSHITINNATPQNGQYVSYIDLASKKPFFFGNFDNSDNEITSEDLRIWIDLIENNPEKYAAVNIDGFMGIDLFDVSLLQSNWGMQAPLEAEVDNNVTQAQLLAMFGHPSNTAADKDKDGSTNKEEFKSASDASADSDSDNLSNIEELTAGSTANVVYAPNWLLMITSK